MDGFTGAIQERMKSEYKTQSGHMMLQMNLWSTLFLGVALILTGELWRFVDFVGRYPYVIYHIIIFSALSALGQVCTLYIILIRIY
jgi:UDP-galactose transporter B1